MDAFERFAASPLPTEAEEVWRYSRISNLDLDAYTLVDDGAPPVVAVPEQLGPLLQAAGEHSAMVLVRNGRIAVSHVDPSLAERGVYVGPLAGARAGADLLGSVAGPVDPFVSLSTAFMTDALVVQVPRGVVVPHPVVILHWIDAGDAPLAVFPRLIVQAGESAQVTVLDHTGSPPGVAPLVAPVVELAVADNANVGYLAIQELGREAWQIGYHASRVGADATLTSSIVALGGGYARIRTDSELIGRGGASNLLAAYFGDGDQMHDFRTLQDHAAPRTTSKLLFKGAVEDESHAVYSGLIRVRKGAAGTDAEQTNRNLVLDAGARADSVPNLEIEENDVRCTHASAVGPVDEDQRYYLEARGVPPAVAERLIVLGFFDDVIAHRQAPVPELRPLLRAAVAAKLSRDAT